MQPKGLESKDDWKAVEEAQDAWSSLRSRRKGWGRSSGRGNVPWS